MGKLLFIFLLGQGHLSVCASVAKALLYKYPEHEIYFLADDEFAEKVKKISPLFKPVLIDVVKPPTDGDSKFMTEFGKNFYKVSKERYSSAFFPFEMIMHIYKLNQKKTEAIINEIKPDVILIDQLFNLPYVENKNIPWGCIASCNQLFIDDSPNRVPTMSGLSVKEDPKVFAEYKQIYYDSNTIKLRNQWFKDNGVKLDDEKQWMLVGSKYLNLQTYPKYANYFSEKDVKGKWFFASSSILPDEVEEKISPKGQNKVKFPGKELLTEEFLKKPGLLILFSMGTLVTAHVDIMNKLLEQLKPLQHKFIVSGGPNFDKLNMPDNCVGAPYLDQKELYPIIDFMISHGGNNTFCELFYFYQKPFICIPMFGDQPDNAQRLVDLEVGSTIPLGEFSTQKISDLIDQVSTNEKMKEKMKEAGKLSVEDDGFFKFIDELNLYLTKQKK